MSDLPRLVTRMYERHKPATVGEALKRVREFAIKRAAGDGLDEFIYIDAAINVLDDATIDKRVEEYSARRAAGGSER